jgi:hypothetical protein
MQKYSMQDLVAEARRVLANAERELGTIPPGQLVDLLADNIVDVPLVELREALKIMGRL